MPTRNPSNVNAAIGPLIVLSEASYTRPADTVTYAAGDVIAQSTSAATILTFANLGRVAGGGGFIQNAVLICSTAPALKLDAELYLFDTAPAMQNDNVAWAPSDAEMEKCLGVIAFSTGSFKVAGANGMTDAGTLSKSYKCATAQTSLFGILVARNAYVPASAEKFAIRLTAAQS